MWFSISAKGSNACYIEKIENVQLWDGDADEPQEVHCCSIVEVKQLYKGSYMSAHVLLILLNELGKRDKMRGLPSILSLFRNEFNEFNNTRVRMLDSFYHMTNTLKSHFWRKNGIILSLCTQRCYGRHNFSRKSITTSGLSILLHGVISLPDATSYDKE